jgi:hypothetical protein
MASGSRLALSLSFVFPIGIALLARLPGLYEVVVDRLECGVGVDSVFRFHTFLLRHLGHSLALRWCAGCALGHRRASFRRLQPAVR